MKIGLDTSILVYLIEGNEKAEQLISKAIQKKDILLISVVTIAELYKYSHKQKLSPVDKKELFTTLTDIEKGFEVVDLTPDIARKAASISHGTDLHMMDALILATVIIEDCDKFYTTDSDFRAYKDNIPQIHIMSFRSAEIS